jgi:hypothetical protein
MGYTPAGGENAPAYIITFEDEDGKKHDIVVDSLPATVADKDGDIYVVNEDGEITPAGNENNGDNSGNNAEDRPIFETDKNKFLYVIVAERSDTLMNGHSSTLPKSTTPIKFNIGYLTQDLANCASDTLWKAGYRWDFQLSQRWDERIDMSKTKWTLLSVSGTQVAAGTGPSISIAPEKMDGSMKLRIDAREALSVRIEDIKSGADTLVTGNMLTGNQIEITLHFAEGGILRFKPKDEAYYKDYGFDDAMTRELQEANRQTRDYEQITISGTDYYVPWLGVLPNTEVEIKLEYTSKNLELDSLIVLEGDKAELVFLKNNTNKLPLNFLFESRVVLKTKKSDTYTINAYLYQKGNIKTLIGQLKVESKDYNTTQKKIRIIRVRRSNENNYIPFRDAQKSELVENINNYYKQTFIKFELDTDYQDTLTISKSSNDVINDLEKDLYKKLPNDMKKTQWYYLFICSQGKDKNTEAGIGRLLFNYSILFNPSGATPSHELGHNLGLQHIFDNKDDNEANICKVGNRILNKLATENIMDYIYAGEEHRHYFFKYQIDYLKNK